VQWFRFENGHLQRTKYLTLTSPSWSWECRTTKVLIVPIFSNHDFDRPVSVKFPTHQAFRSCAVSVSTLINLSLGLKNLPSHLSFNSSFFQASFDFDSLVFRFMNLASNPSLLQVINYFIRVSESFSRVAPQSLWARWNSSDVAPASTWWLASSLIHAILPFLSPVIRRQFRTTALAWSLRRSICSHRKGAVGTGCALANARHGPRVALFSMPSRRYPAVPPGVSWACNGEHYATNTRARRGGQTSFPRDRRDCLWAVLASDDGCRVETLLCSLEWFRAGNRGCQI